MESQVKKQVVGYRSERHALVVVRLNGVDASRDMTDVKT